MLPVVFASLDQTLIASVKSYLNRRVDNLERVTTSTDGNHGYMCEKRSALLAWLSTGATLIPVTARNLEEYRRVHLETFTEGAVLSNGALILNAKGKEDRAWSGHVADLCERSEHLMDAVVAVSSKLPVNVRVVRNEHKGQLQGLTFHSNDETEQGVMLNLGMVQQGFQQSYPTAKLGMHLSGNSLTFTPAGVSRRGAVQYLLSVREDLRGRPTVGLGGEKSDLCFMELCTMAIVPEGSPNAATLFR